MQVHGLRPPALFAALTIAVELLGSALAGHERFLATNAFFEHLGLIAAFVIAALYAGARLRT